MFLSGIHAHSLFHVFLPGALQKLKARYLKDRLQDSMQDYYELEISVLSHTLILEASIRNG